MCPRYLKLSKCQKHLHSNHIGIHIMLNSFLSDNKSDEKASLYRQIPSTEGISRQLLGDVVDVMSIKRFRTALKITGWTGWDSKRMHKGIDEVEREVLDMISSNVRKHNLGEEMSYEALDSWLATNASATSVIRVLIDDTAYAKLLKACSKDQLDLNGYGTFVDNLIEEITGSDVREIMKKKVKSYSDLSKLFSDSCDKCRKIIDASVKANGGKLPKYLIHQQFLGLNALSELAMLMRSMMRRAV